MLWRSLLLWLRDLLRWGLALVESLALVEEELAAENTIVYAEMKMTEKLAIRHGCFFEYNALEDDDEFVIECEDEVKKTEKFATPQLVTVDYEALRAPSPAGTPGPTAGIKVSSPPKRCCTPPNLAAGHIGVDHPPSASEAGLGVSFGEIPAPTSYNWGSGVLATFSRR